MTHGISFPADPDGERSTTPVGRAVVADALRPVDPVGARAAEQETAWRSRYLAAPTPAGRGRAAPPPWHGWRSPTPAWTPYDAGWS